MERAMHSFSIRYHEWNFRAYLGRTMACGGKLMDMLCSSQLWYHTINHEEVNGLFGLGRSRNKGLNTVE